MGLIHTPHWGICFMGLLYIFFIPLSCFVIVRGACCSPESFKLHLWLSIQHAQRISSPFFPIASLMFPTENVPLQAVLPVCFPDFFRGSRTIINGFSQIGSFLFFFSNGSVFHFIFFRNNSCHFLIPVKSGTNDITFIPIPDIDRSAIIGTNKYFDQKVSDNFSLA